MAPIRMSGMNSGLDTESIVKAMVQGYEAKKQKVEKNQTKLEWSQEIWKGLNSKVYSLYTGMDKYRFSSSYKSKKTNVSDPTKVSVKAGAGAVDGTQKLKVKKMATAGYLTGGKIQTENGDDVNSYTKLSALGIEDDSSFTLGIGNNKKTITLTGDMSVKDLITEMQDAGVNASFDEKNGRFFISSKASGADNDFTISGNGDSGIAALQSLGLYTKSDEDLERLNTLKDMGTYKNGVLDVSATKEDIKDQFANIKERYYTVLEEKTSLTNQQEDITTQKTELEESKSPYTEKISEYEEQKSPLEEEKKGIDDYIGVRNEIGDYLSSKRLMAQKEKLYPSSWLADDADYQKALAYTSKVESDVAEGKTHNDVKFYVNRAVAAYDAAQGGSSSDYDAAISAINSDYNYNTTVINKKQAASDELASQIAEIDSQIEEENSHIAEIDSKISELDTQYSDLQSQVEDAESRMEEIKSELDDSPLFSGLDIDASETKVASQAIERIQAAISELDSPDVSTATRVHGEDAEIYLNGAMFTSDTNSFSINGLDLTITGVTGNDEISITTSSDNDAIYDKVKDFMSAYNDIINELQSLYNAEDAKDYEPLTEDEKAEMNDTEIEKWETKIKDALLRRDSTLGGVINTMTMAMSKSYEVTMKDGTKKSMGLVNVGVHTLGYLNAGQNERYAYHIDGDSDDSITNGYADKLRAMIEEDPDAVASLMSQVSQGLYEALGTKIGSTSTELSSAYTMYNDKQMKSQLSTYKKTISDWEDRIADTEEMYYKKFTAMEKALANINSSQSSLSGLMG